MKIIKMSIYRFYVVRALAFALALMTTSAVSRTQGTPDYSKVEIKTARIADNFYTLEGQGGTIGVLTGPDGVFMVDSQFAPLTAKIVAAVKQITSEPIRFMVNTHLHPDHTGGNENLGKMGVIILGRDELRKRLAEGVPAVNGAGGRTPAPPAALPMITYQGKVTFHMDGEDVELIPIPRAHTDGDTIVRFPKINVIMTGDFYRSLGYPNIDRPSGGTLNGTIEGLAYVASLAGPGTKIIPGHGVAVTRAEVLATRDMIVDVRDRVALMMRQGKSVQGVLAAHPTASYDSKIPQGAETSERFVTQVYAELQPSIRGTGQ
jgi:glyoxylase-like metal-dependent hydrolase (beta-lactamase superfamily II)